MSLRFTVLGCGSSGGVPRVGQGWGACDPDNSKNRRRRCSLLIERPGADGASTQVLVDTSPDLRAQLLDANVEKLDAILMTHQHADHTHGIDDVRPLVLKAGRRIPIHMNDATRDHLLRTFGYIFETPPGSQYPPLLDAHLAREAEAISIDGPGGSIEAVPFTLRHGEIDAFGYRVGQTAYTPDVKSIPDAALEHLRDLDLWIVDALRFTPHPSHFSVSDALEWIARLSPKRAVLTNLHTDLDFEKLRLELPANVEPAYDGMVISA